VIKEKVIRMTLRPAPVKVKRPRIRLGIIAVTWNHIFILPSSFFGKVYLNRAFSFHREDVRDVHMRPDIFRASLTKMKYKLNF